MSEEQTLIKMLEKATGPNFDLDAEIALANGYRCKGSKLRVGISDGLVWAEPGENFSMGTRPPRYTSSLDAAMTLVPEGFFLAEFGECAGIKGWWKARIAPRRPNSTTPAMYQHHYVGFTDGGKPKTGPVALCIAALKARATP